MPNRNYAKRTRQDNESKRGRTHDDELRVRHTLAQRLVVQLRTDPMSDECYTTLKALKKIDVHVSMSGARQEDDPMGAGNIRVVPLRLRVQTRGGQQALLQALKKYLTDKEDCQASAQVWTFANRWARMTLAGWTARMTVRERVTEYYVEGWTPDRIAETLGQSVKTVQSYVLQTVHPRALRVLDFAGEVQEVCRVREVLLQLGNDVPWAETGAQDYIGCLAIRKTWWVHVLDYERNVYTSDEPEGL